MLTAERVGLGVGIFALFLVGLYLMVRGPAALGQKHEDVAPTGSLRISVRGVNVEAQGVELASRLLGALAMCAAIVAGVWGFNTLGAAPAPPSKGSTNSATTMRTPTPTPTATIVPAPSPTPSPPPPSGQGNWQPWYGPTTPCPGAQWVVLRQNVSCSGGTLNMSPNSPYYPELDLNSTPSQTTFIFKAHAHFTTPASYHYGATLVVDAPVGASNYGGLGCDVRPNGQWDVMQSDTSKGGTLEPVQYGSVGASQDYDLQAQVSDGMLYCYIDTTLVSSISTSQNLNAGPVYALIEYLEAYGDAGDVQWSRVEIDTPA